MEKVHLERAEKKRKKRMLHQDFFLAVLTERPFHKGRARQRWTANTSGHNKNTSTFLRIRLFIGLVEFIRRSQNPAEKIDSKLKSRKSNGQGTSMTVKD